MGTGSLGVAAADWASSARASSSLTSRMSSDIRTSSASQMAESSSEEASFCPAPPRRDSRVRLGRTRRLRAEYGPGAGAADAARHPAGDGAESSVAPSSDRVAASFSPHRTALRRGRAGSDVVFTQGCKHQNPPFCSVSCARSFPVCSSASSLRSTASTLRTLSLRISARSPFNRRASTFPPAGRNGSRRRGPSTATKTVRRADRPGARARRRRWSRCPSQPPAPCARRPPSGPRPADPRLLGWPSRPASTPSSSCFSGVE
ncbi:hypothetical protein SCYAM73S_01264 [Streptomyces cyaneofuscatus]